MAAAPSLLRRAVAVALLAAGCSPAPKLGAPPDGATPTDPRPRVVLESATVTGGRFVAVTYRIVDTRGTPATPITGGAATALAPTWTLAWLAHDPVTPSIPAWQSLVRTGRQTVPSLPMAGPETPPAYVYPDQRQPGSVTGGGVENADGGFTFTLPTQLGTEFDPTAGAERAATLRVGVFLDATTPTQDSSATLDFTAAGSPPTETYDNVADGLCNGCHGLVVGHGHRTGVKLCATCHTWQNADPDTADPAAMSPGPDTNNAATLNARAAAKRLTNPNPLELGRFMHRLHRGKNLPTLYRSAACYTSSTKKGVTTPAADKLCNMTTLPPTFPASGPPAAPPVPPLPKDTANRVDAPWTVPALPFRPGRNSVGPVGLRQSVIGEGGVELLIGKIGVSGLSHPATVTSNATAEGIGYPQDLRNCAACHSGGTSDAISRRLCSGCHPDVWYGTVDAGRPATDSTDPAIDAFHLPHSGGPQADDSQCRGCHVDSTGYRKVPFAELHSPPAVSKRWKKPVFEIVDVQDLLPGAAGPAYATLRFRVYEAGDPAKTPLTPLNAPTPAMDADPDQAARSPVPRKLTSLTVRIGGPNTDFVTGGGVESWTNGTFTRTFSYAVASATTPSGGLASTSVAPPWQVPCTTPLLTLAADAQGVFTCTFPNPLANLDPAQVGRYWTLGMEGRRASSQTQYGVPAPYTGLSTEYPVADWPWYGWVLGYDPSTDTFRWPGTGETVTESADYAPVAVDLTTGTLATSPDAPRRKVVSAEKCNACHLRFTFHGSSRPDPNMCLYCHAADATDWNYRPRDLRSDTRVNGPGTGQVLLTQADALESPASTTKAWSYYTIDGIEERSIQLKTFIHRIHTGEREGAASLEGIEPFVVHTSPTGAGFLNEVRYPNRLDNCEACHLSGTWRIESVPATAMPTVANEEGTLTHLAPADADQRPAVATSPDGVTWTPRAIPATNFAGISWTGSTFVAVASNSLAAFSADGITWTFGSFAAPYTPCSGSPVGNTACAPVGNFSAAAWNATAGYVAVGASLAAYSPTGLAWDKATLPAAPTGVTLAFTGMVWTGTQFVGVGTDFAATSADGKTWTLATTPPAGTFMGLAWNGTTLVAVGPNVAATSTNGTDWTNRTMPVGLYRGVAWNGSVFAAVGYGVAATSTNGTTWTAATIPAGDYHAVASNGSGFVAIGASAAATSSNGATWTARTVPAAEYQSVAWNGTGYVAVGRSPWATSRHTASDHSLGAVASACRSCHTSGAARVHAEAKTLDGVEQCVTCHGEGGAQSVRRRHAVP